MTKKYSKKELEALGKDWDDAGDEDGELPDGDYQCKIVSADLLCEPGKRRQVKTVLKVVGGDEDYVDKEVTFFDGLESAQNIGFFKRKLRKVRVVCEPGAEGLIEAVEALEGMTIEVRIKNKDGFCNCYFNKLVKDAEDADADEEEEEEEEAPKKKKKGAKPAPATKGKKKPVDDEDDEEEEEEEEEEDEEEEEEEEDEEEEDAAERTFPELDDLDDLDDVKAGKQLTKLFPGSEPDKAKGKRLGALKYLVATMEGDEYEPDDGDHLAAAKVVGLKVKSTDKTKQVAKLIEARLGEMFED